jgi:undecaprenyl-diphosphatase
MTFLLSGFGLLGRFAGDLLMSALGWASSLLFGRVPRSHQIFLVLMMAGSFWWLLVVLGLLVPGTAAWIFAATPRPTLVDRAWLDAFLIAALVLLPPAVGLAGYLVPSAGERQGGAAVIAETLRGYLLAPVIAGILIFLAAVGIARKVRSARHGWADAHVPVMAAAGGYSQMADALADALGDAGLPVTERDAPWVLTLPARVLTAVAGGNVRNLRPDRLVELRGDGIRIGVYPSDIAISGTRAACVRARIAVRSRLAATSSRLTTSAEAQEVEDIMKRLATSAAAGGAGTAAGAFADIDDRLLALRVPDDEWDLLYGVRLGLERDLLAGSVPGSVFPGSGRTGAAAAAPADPAVAPPAGGLPAKAGRRPGSGLRLLATASLLAFAALTIAVGMRVVFPFDAPILAAALALNGVPGFWEFMSQTANFPLIAIAVITFLWLVRAKRYREAVLVAVMLAAVTAGSEAVKQLTARPRPSGSGDGIPGVVYSYPSGHVLEAMTILGMLVVRAWRVARRLWAKIAFAAVVAVEVILVGIGRMALDAHYPTDLLAGVLGSIGALGWYGWLTRAGGWADQAAPVVRRAAAAVRRGGAS